MRVTEGQNVFAMKKSKFANVADSIIALGKDEEALKNAVVDVVSIVSTRLREMGVVSQERIRDTIRSETFALLFRERVLGLPPGHL